MTAAFQPFPEVTSARIVPNGDRFELIVSTRESPPEPELVQRLWDVSGERLARPDSPVAEELEAGVSSTAWHFDPPLDRHEKELFEALDWDRALVVHGARP